MNRRSTIWAIAVVAYAIIEAAQVNPGFHNHSFTGTVVAADDASGEITLQAKIKGQVKTFTGTLDWSLPPTKEHPTPRKMKPSEIPLNEEVTVHFKTEPTGHDESKKRFRIYKVVFYTH